MSIHFPISVIVYLKIYMREGEVGEKYLAPNMPEIHP
jgi:hypothetical protein